MWTVKPLPDDECVCNHEYRDHQNSLNDNTLCQKCGCTKFLAKWESTVVDILNRPLEDF